MATKVYNATLSIFSCSSCHNDFGVPSQFASHGKQYGGKVWCPVCGNRMNWGSSEIDELRSQLAREEGKVANARMQAKHAENRRRAQKAQTTKLKNRIAAGVCPCCKRHFANVQKHIAGQHPEFAGGVSDQGTMTEGQS